MIFKKFKNNHNPTFKPNHHWDVSISYKSLRMRLYEFQKVKWSQIIVRVCWQYYVSFSFLFPPFACFNVADLCNLTVVLILDLDVHLAVWLSSLTLKSLLCCSVYHSQCQEKIMTTTKKSYLYWNAIVLSFFPHVIERRIPSVFMQQWKF